MCVERETGRGRGKEYLNWDGAVDVVSSTSTSRFVIGSASAGELDSLRDARQILPARTRRKVWYILPQRLKDPRAKVALAALLGVTVTTLPGK